MKEGSQDRRTQRTRQAIHEAVFSLMQEKQYSKITIQDIIDRANVGRSTFYSHYATKEELLLSSVENMFEMMSNFIDNSNIGEGDKPRIIPVFELFDHIKDNSKVIKGLIKADEGALFFEKVQKYWNRKIEDYLKLKLSFGKQPAVPLEIVANHISGTLINLLKWWIDNKMTYSPIEMENYFQELINPNINAIV